MMASNKNEGEWKFYILQEFINRGWIKKVKKVRKKGSTFCPPEKVRSEGSPFINFFSIVEKTGNIQMLASWYKAYIRRFGEDMKKGGWER